MSNSGAPIGESGRKELKVVESDQGKELLEAYFEELREEGYGSIQIKCMTFEVPKMRDKNSELINVIGRGAKVEKIALIEGAAKRINSAPKGKVAAKVNQIKNNRRNKDVADKRER